jgi:hypothetical protein
MSKEIWKILTQIYENHDQGDEISALIFHLPVVQTILGSFTT